MRRTAQEIVSVMDGLSDICLRRQSNLPKFQEHDPEFILNKLELVAECVRDLARIETERQRSALSPSQIREK